MSEPIIGLKLKHKQETNMGCNISTVAFNQPITVQDIIDYALTYKDMWGSIKIYNKGESIFDWTDELKYYKGEVEAPFEHTDTKSIVDKADCWHSWGNADYYISIAEMESE